MPKTRSRSRSRNRSKSRKGGMWPFDAGAPAVAPQAGAPQASSGWGFGNLLGSKKEEDPSVRPPQGVPPNGMSMPGYGGRRRSRRRTLRFRKRR
jgi:hypothetical protein